MYFNSTIMCSNISEFHPCHLILSQRKSDISSVIIETESTKYMTRGWDMGLMHQNNHIYSLWIYLPMQAYFRHFAKHA